MLARGHKIPKGKGLVGRAADTNTPILVADPPEPNWLPNPAAARNEIRGRRADFHRRPGAGRAGRAAKRGRWLEQDDADLLQSIANQVAIAVRNARSYSLKLRSTPSGRR